MKVAQTDKLEIVEVAICFAKAQEAAAAGVNEDARFAINPDNIGRGCTAVVGNRAARAKYLQRNTFGRWALLISVCLVNSEQQEAD